MMTEDAEALKRKRFSLLQRARELVDTAEMRGELSRDSQREYDHLIEQADDLETRINTIEAGWRDHSKRDLQARLGRYASTGPLAGRPQSEGRYNYMSNEDGFSIVRAIRAMVNSDWRGAEHEREASDRAAKELGRESRGGLIIPDDVWLPSRQEHRDLLKGTGNVGGYMVGTDLLGERFIDRLVNKSVMLSAGVVTMDGLVGDVGIPRLATGPTAYWVAENAPITEGAQTFEQVALSPKTVGAYIDVSRRLLQQASLDVENMVRNDILKSLATAIDLAILQGTGTDQPTGVVNTTNVTDCSGATGDTLSWAEVVELETTIATANADNGRLAYITNPTLRGVMKQTLITPTYGEEMIWDRKTPAAPVNGYACYVTSQIPADLTKGGGSSLSYLFFGDWSQVILGRWSGLDVLIDPYTGGTAGTVRIIAFSDVDVAVRHPEAFAFGFYS
jgi:HK97 family phage major capsid protein